MRAFLLILILAVVAVIAAVATGFLDINQIRGAKAPQITTTREGVTAKGGQAPAFEVKTGGVGIGSRETTVKVPAIEIHPANGAAAPAAQAPTAAPAPANSNSADTGTNAVQR